MAGHQQTLRVKENLNTAPLEWALLYVGDCIGCDRPMAPKRKMIANTELARWFVCCGSKLAGLCITCQERRRLTGSVTPVCRSTGYRIRRPVPKPVVPMSTARLRADRIAVGACPGCGWTRDVGPHAGRDCPIHRAKTRKVA